MHAAGTNISSFEPGIAKVAPELLAPLSDMGVPPAEAATARARMDQYVEGIANWNYMWRLVSRPWRQSKPPQLFPRER